MPLSDLIADRLLLYRFLLSAFFVWWGWTVAAGDLKTKRIPNRMVLAGLAAALATLLLYALETVLGGAGLSADYLNWKFFGYYLFSLAASSVVGIFLWYGEVWPAGDAKFFMASLALLPLINYQIRSFPKTLWLSVLINSFVLGAVYYIFRFLAQAYRGWKNGDQDRLRKWEAIRQDLLAGLNSLRGGNPGKAAVFAVSLFLIFFLYKTVSFSLMGQLQHLVPDINLIFFLLFIGWDKVSRFVTGIKFKGALGLLVLGYFGYGLLNFRSELLLSVQYSAWNVIKFSVILGAGRFVLVYLLEKFSTVEVSAAEVAPGMILSQRYFNIIRRDSFFKGGFEDSFRDGITEEEAGRLKEWVAKIPHESPKIEVMTGTPFAVWIFAGCLFQLFFNGNIFTSLGRLAGLVGSL
ncbi:MAG: prepilin peptidase [Elusimicrobiales bacterium]